MKKLNLERFNLFNLKKKEYLLLLLSAAALACSFENINLDILIFVALFPLFSVIDGKSQKDAFKAGFFTGIVFYFLTIYWLVYTISFYGKINLILSFFIFLLLVLYLALYIGLFALLHKKITKRFDSVFAAPVIFVAFEYLKTHLMSGFPWILFGYSLYDRPSLIQFSDITGVYGVTFLIVLINSAAYRLYLYFKRDKKRTYLAECAASAVILIAVSLYGTDTINNGLIDAYEPIKVGLTQGNIDQDLKWDKDYKDETMDIYFDLTDDVTAELAEYNDEEEDSPVLIVWPETAAPFYMQTETKYRSELLKLANRTRAYILTGGLAFDLNDDTEAEDNYFLFNSAFLLSPEDKVLGRYDKVHLVPFGEYVPLAKILFFVNKITEGIGDFTSGDEAKNLVMNDHDIKLAVLICYESIFPDLVRRFVDDGADVLVNITNDAWFGRTSAPYQQISMAALRAAENKRYLIRAANTGISTIIDPFGRTVKRTSIFEKAYITGEINKVEKTTFYTVHGDLFSKVVSGVFLILLILSFMKKEKPVQGALL